jgi:glycosyltransferase involved in cell wall biosynthesis
MPKLIDKISVFFPAYNEEKNIEKTVLSAKKVLEKVANKWEIIVVNDGSSDDTRKIVNKLGKEDKRIKVISHKKNRGYGAGLKTGLYSAKYPWIAYTDADGQFDFSEIKYFIKTQRETEADLVIGKYIDRKVKLSRKLNTYAWETFVNILFGLKVRDIDTGFKMLSKKVVDKLPELKSERGAFIESEMLIYAKKAGFKIEQIGVRHYPRTQGHGTGADLNVIVKSFMDLFKLWKKLR